MSKKRYSQEHLEACVMDRIILIIQCDRMMGVAVRMMMDRHTKLPKYSYVQSQEIDTLEEAYRMALETKTKNEWYIRKLQKMIKKQNKKDMK